MRLVLCVPEGSIGGQKDILPCPEETDFMPGNPWGKHAATHHTHAALKILEGHQGMNLCLCKRQSSKCPLQFMPIFSHIHRREVYGLGGPISSSVFKGQYSSSVTTSLVAVVRSVREPGMVCFVRSHHRKLELKLLAAVVMSDQVPVLFP